MSFAVDIPITLYKSKVLSIDAEHLTFDDLQMEIKDITGFCYGQIVNTSVGLPTGGSHFYKFQDSAGDEIAFGFLNSVLLNSKENKKLGDEVEHHIWEYLGNGLLNRIIRDVHEGREIKIGGAVLKRDGLTCSNPDNMRRSRFVIPWEHAVGNAHNGELIVSSAIRSDDRCSMLFRTTMNALILHRILFYARSNPYLVEVLKGLQPPLA